jgi:hypothetical protein
MSPIGKQSVSLLSDQDRATVPTIEQCKTYASEYKTLGYDPEISSRRSTSLLSISRSWTALAHKLENLAVIVRDEK